MNIKDLYRRILVNWQSFPTITTLLKNSSLIKPIIIFLKILDAVISFFRKILFALLWVAYIILSTVWFFDLILLFNGQYLKYFSVDGNYTFLFLGGIAVLIGLMVIVITYEGKLQAIQNNFSIFIKSTFPYKLINNSIYKFSKYCVDTFVLPNIEIFETGLIGQHPLNFPKIVIYQDDNFRSERHIRRILNKYNQYLGIVPLMLGIGLSILMCILGVLLVSFGQLLNIEFAGKIGNVLYISSWFIVASSSILMPLANNVLLYHPESLIYKRLQILRNDIVQLQKEEWEGESNANPKNNSEKLIEKSSAILTEINNTLRQEAMKLSRLQQQAFLTKENIEAMKNFKNGHPEAALLMYKEQEKYQEEREKKMRWRQWLRDILIGIISALIFRMIFG